MTSPSGTYGGPNRDFIEQQIRDVQDQVHSLLGRRIKSVPDHLGNVVASLDPAGGLALPRIPIAMYPLFAMAAGVFSYMTATVNLSEQTLWAGRIQASHPYIGLVGTFGAASGTNTTRYRLKVAGTIVTTWDVSALAAGFGVGTILITPAAVALGGSADVTITAQSLSGSGTYACQVANCVLRGA